MTRTVAPRLLGAVLAGGASRRFGSPKWRASLAGATLGEWAVRALSPSTERVVVISDDPGTRELGEEVWPDLESGSGPLAGILSALVGAERLGLEGVLVLACDLPLVTPSLVAELVARWEEGSPAVAPLGRGGAEPLCALYALAARSAVEAALFAGRRSARRLLETLPAVWLPLEEARRASGRDDPFLNVNTVDDLERARGVLAEEGERGRRGSGSAGQGGG